MALKTASTGQFVIPTSPAVGTTVSSGAANTYTTTYVQLLASTAAAIYIIGAGGSISSTARPTYMHLQIATGSAGAEAIIGQIPGLQYDAAGGASAANFNWITNINPWIPVATATRIAAKTADSTGGLTHAIQLYAINQANVVDAGIVEQADIQTIKTQAASAAGAVTFPSSIQSSTTFPTNFSSLTISAATGAVTVDKGTITTVSGNVSGSVGSVTGSVSSVTASVTLSSGQTITTVSGNVSGSVGSVTGSVSSVTAAVTLPSIPANWITTAGISAGAFASQTISSGQTVASVTGSVSLVTAAITLPSIPANFITAAGISSAAFNGKGDWNIGKTGYSLSSGQSVATVTGSVSSVTASVTLSSGQTISTVSGNVSGSVGSVLGSVGSVTGAVSSVTAAVVLPSIPNNWITAAGISSGAITTTLGAIPANWITAAGISSGAFVSELSGIKTKTDKLTYTTANQVDANIHSVNNITVTGSGTTPS